jgi:hypothetical protein
VAWLRKGFTCSQWNYLKFLESTNDLNEYESYLSASDLARLYQSLESKNPKGPIALMPTSASLQNGSSTLTEKKSTETALMVIDWIAKIPVSITITIEEGYGTRMLPCGNIRYLRV